MQRTGCLDPGNCCIGPQLPGLLAGTVHAVVFVLAVVVVTTHCCFCGYCC